MILGFIAQCSVCPQRAVVDVQPVDGWVCPRCAEVTAPVRTSVWADDEWPVGSVQG